MLKNNSIQKILDAYQSNIPLASLKKLSDDFSAIDEGEKKAFFPRMLKLAILSNYSTQFLRLGLDLAMASKGFGTSIYEAEFDQWEKELIDPNAGAQSFNPDVVLLTLTTASLPFRYKDLSPEDLAHRLFSLVDQAREKWGCQFVMTLPEPLEEEIDPTYWSTHWRNRFKSKLQELFGSLVQLIDLEPLIRKIGHQNWYSSPYFVTSKLISHPNQTALFGNYLATLIASHLVRFVKLIVVDLDNTLWGGIVGEVGWKNVDLDSDGRGFGFLKFQRFLLDMHNRGVLLGLISKNNFEEAAAVFNNRSEMILTLDHFADAQINWEPKSHNMTRLLTNLNLTASGVVFIDDNPAEREEVRLVSEDIFIPDFPEDPMDLVPRLMESGKFSITRVSLDDQKRQKYYKQEIDRKKQQVSFQDLTEYYQSLNLELEAEPITIDNQKRALDLISKTNQFNLTTRRHGIDDLKRLISTKHSYCTLYSLKDKFGDYGHIGVLLALPENEDKMRIDTLLLSCRAMGRTVENAMLFHFSQECAKRKRPILVGEYIPTKKNKPVADLFTKLGFRIEETTGLYTFNASIKPLVNEFVRIIEDPKHNDLLEKV